MSKKILEVRFVNFGDGFNCVAQLRSCSEIDMHTTPFALEANGNIKFVQQNSFVGLKKETDAWIETLNSADAPVPRIEHDSGQSYKLFSAASSFSYITETNIEAINGINARNGDHPLEIYEPKKYVPKWVKIFPRKFLTTDVPNISNEDSMEAVNFKNGALTALRNANQLQLTEANGLEVWALTVFEETK